MVPCDLLSIRLKYKSRHDHSLAMKANLDQATFSASPCESRMAVDGSSYFPQTFFSSEYPLVPPRKNLLTKENSKNLDISSSSIMLYRRPGMSVEWCPMISASTMIISIEISVTFSHAFCDFRWTDASQKTHKQPNYCASSKNRSLWISHSFCDRK